MDHTKEPISEIEQIDNELSNSDPSEKIEKPRLYQQRVFEIAKNQNVIAVGPTGSGKTKIAGMVIQHVIDRTLKVKKLEEINVIFAVNKVLLVHQQHEYLQKQLKKEITINKYWGEKKGVDYWKKRNWKKEIVENQVMVMTGQIVVNILSHGFLSVSDIDLIIIDECHHSSKNSPYGQMMRDFYFDAKINGEKVPQIFGMTASPFSLNRANISLERKREMISKLIKIQEELDSVVYVLGSVEMSNSLRKHIIAEDDEVEKEKEELKKYVAEPKIFPIEYKSELNSEEQNIMNILTTVERFGDTEKIDWIKGVISKAKNLLLEVGLWGTYFYLKEICEVVESLSRKSYFSRNFVIRSKIPLKRDVVAVIKPILNKFSNMGEIPKEEQINIKTRALLNILLEYQESNPDFCAMVFVTRRITAYILHKIIKLTDYLTFKSAAIFGIGTRSSESFEKSKGYLLNSKKQQKIMREFGKSLKVIVTTSVAEEGVDIQACNLVIRFDLFNDLKSYIQSKGRARKKNSDFIMMYDKNDYHQKKLIESIQRSERDLIKVCIQGHELGKMGNKNKILEDSLFIRSTGAKVTLALSVQKLSHYCSLLPTDIYTGPMMPVYTYSGISPNIICSVELPINSAIKKIIKSKECYTERDAKRSAALNAIRELYKTGHLNENLLPKHHHNIREFKKNVLEQTELLENRKTSSLNEYDVIRKSNYFSNKWIDDIIRKKTEAKPEEEEEKPEEKILHVYYFDLFYSTKKTNEKDEKKDSGVPLFNDSISRKTKFPFGLIIDKKLKLNGDIPKIELNLKNYNDNEKELSKLEFKYGGEVVVNLKELDILIKFHMFLFSIIMGCKFTGFKGNNFLIFPVKTVNIDSSRDSEDNQIIDWDYAIRNLEASSKNMDYVGKFKENDIIVTKYEKKIIILEKISEIFCTDPYFYHMHQKEKKEKKVEKEKKEENSIILEEKENENDKKKNVIERTILEHLSYCFSDYFSKSENKIRDDIPLLLGKKILLFSRSLRKYKHYKYNNQKKYFKRFKNLFIGKKKQKKAINEKLLYIPQDHVIKLEIKKDEIENIKSIPKIFWSLENYLIVSELNCILENKLDLNLLKIGLTASSTMEKYNYERLEFLGDSILKYIICKDLFCKYSGHHCGLLSQEKLILLSNKYLLNKTIKNKLYKFVQTEVLTKKKWKAPGYDFIEKDDENINSTERNIVLNDKLLADLIESLVAVCYLCGGIKKCIKFLIELGFPILQNCYKDYFFEKDINDRSKEENEELDKLYEKYNIAALEDKVLNYKFKNKKIILRALTHQSYGNRELGCYQRLEFLGDAVLDLILTELYFKKYPNLPPANLSDLRNVAISNELFGYVVLTKGIHNHLIHSSHRLVHVIKKYQRDLVDTEELLVDVPKTLADILESIAGAIFIDSGYNIDVVEKAIIPLMKEALEKFVVLEKLKINPVRMLTELLNSSGNGSHNFSFIQKPPNENSPLFSCTFVLNGNKITYATGGHKKAARKKCAMNALDIIKFNPNFLEVKN